MFSRICISRLIGALPKSSFGCMDGRGSRVINSAVPIACFKRTYKNHSEWIAPSPWEVDEDLNDAQSWLKSAHSHLMVGNVDAGVLDAEVALGYLKRKKKPKFSFPFFGILGCVHFERGDLEQAAQYFNQAVECCEDHETRMTLSDDNHEIGSVVLDQASCEMVKDPSTASTKNAVTRVEFIHQRSYLFSMPLSASLHTCKAFLDLYRDDDPDTAVSRLRRAVLDMKSIEDGVEMDEECMERDVEEFNSNGVAISTINQNYFRTILNLADLVLRDGGVSEFRHIANDEIKPLLRRDDPIRTSGKKNLFDDLRAKHVLLRQALIPLVLPKEEGGKPATPSRVCSARKKYEKLLSDAVGQIGEGSLDIARMRLDFGLLFKPAHALVIIDSVRSILQSKGMTSKHPWIMAVDEIRQIADTHRNGKSYLVNYLREEWCKRDGDEPASMLLLPVFSFHYLLPLSSILNEAAGCSIPPGVRTEPELMQQQQELSFVE